MQEQLIKLLPIKTERLLLKKTTISDIDLILKQDKQENTQKFLGGIKEKSIEERLLFLEKKDKNNRSLTVYLNNIPIGFIGLDINDFEAEISYIFDSDYTSNGYCSEVVNKLVEISFSTLNLNKIFAYSKKDNISSRKVLEKNRFVEVGTKEDFIYYELKKEVEI